MPFVQIKNLLVTYAPASPCVCSRDVEARLSRIAFTTITPCVKSLQSTRTLDLCACSTYVWGKSYDAPSLLWRMLLLFLNLVTGGGEPPPPLPPPLNWHHKFWDRRSNKEEPARKRLVEQLPCGSFRWRSLESWGVILNAFSIRAFSSLPSYPLLLAPSNANTAPPPQHHRAQVNNNLYPHLAIFFNVCNSSPFSAQLPCDGIV